MAKNDLDKLAWHNYANFRTLESQKERDGHRWIIMTYCAATMALKRIMDQKKKPLLEAAFRFCAFLGALWLMFLLPDISFVWIGIYDWAQIVLWAFFLSIQRDVSTQTTFQGNCYSNIKNFYTVILYGHEHGMRYGCSSGTVVNGPLLTWG